MAPEFHWLEDETDKQHRPTGRVTQVVPPQESRRSGLPRFAGVALLFVLSITVGVSGAIWIMSHRGLNAARADIEAVVRTESQALARGDQELFQSLQEEEPVQGSVDFFERMQNEVVVRATTGVDTEQPLRISNLELLEDRAWAEVAFTRDGEAYSRMQFYRLVEGRWRRTLPDVRFWGEARTLQTGHLLFMYHEREESIVSALAPWAEVAYNQIIRDFGTQPWSTPIVIEFNAAEDGRTTDTRSGRFGLPSPFLTGYNDDGRPDDTLRYSVAYDLALLSAVNRAGLTRRSQTDVSWLMLNSVVHWEVAKLIPGVGSSDTNVPSELVRQSTRSAIRGNESMLGLFPDTATGAERIKQAVRDNKLLPLAALWPPYRLMRSGEDFNLALLQAQTMLEYAVEKAGPEVVPSFLISLGQGQPMSRSIETVFGVETDQFEAGWMKWLQLRYGES